MLLLILEEIRREIDRYCKNGRKWIRDILKGIREEKYWKRERKERKEEIGMERKRDIGRERKRKILEEKEEGERKRNTGRREKGREIGRDRKREILEECKRDNEEKVREHIGRKRGRRKKEERERKTQWKEYIKKQQQQQ